MGQKSCLGSVQLGWVETEDITGSCSYRAPNLGVTQHFGPSAHMALPSWHMPPCRGGEHGRPFPIFTSVHSHVLRDQVGHAKAQAAGFQNRLAGRLEGGMLWSLCPTGIRWRSRVQEDIHSIL